LPRGRPRPSSTEPPSKRLWAWATSASGSTAPDHRPEFVLVDQAAEGLEFCPAGTDEEEMVGRVHAPSGEKVPRLGNVHDRHHAASVGQNQRTAGEGVPAHRVQHDVHLAQGLHLRHIVSSREVDRDVRSQPGDDVVIPLPRGGDHLSPQRTCDLDGNRTDPARAAVHQDRLPGPFDQRLPRRHTHESETGGLDMRQAGGLAGDQGLVDHVDGAADGQSPTMRTCTRTATPWNA
jgi:hypothetical protein